MEQPQRINPVWLGEPTIVAASGPSLNADVIRICRMARWTDQWRVLAVNDAARAMPWADAAYAADQHWWQHHKGLPEFEGQRFCPVQRSIDGDEDATAFAGQFPTVRMVAACAGTDFSRDQSRIHFGEPENSGFQAINLALLLGAARVVLVGFDARCVDGKSHFFGDHPEGINRLLDQPKEFRDAEMARIYASIARSFDGVVEVDRILNATPDSAITRFEPVPLHEALSRNNGLYRNGSQSHAAAS